MNNYYFLAGKVRFLFRKKSLFILAAFFLLAGPVSAKNIIMSASTSDMVGIGTINPEYKLDILGNARLGMAVSGGRYSIFDTSGRLVINYNDNTSAPQNLLTLRSTDISAGFSHANKINFTFARTADSTERQGGGLLFGKEQEWTSSGATNDTYFSIQTALDGTVSEKIRVSSKGDVGIGTNNPASRLTLSGGDFEIDHNRSIKLSSSSLNTTLLIANYADNLGSPYFFYGTSTQPTNKTASLAVEGDVKADRFCIEEDCKAAWSEVVAAGGGNQWITSGNDIYSGNSGNVGIGTTTPTNKLVVSNNGPSYVQISGSGESGGQSGIKLTSNYVGAAINSEISFDYFGSYLSNTGSVGHGLNLISGRATPFGNFWFRNSTNNVGAAFVDPSYSVSNMGTFASMNLLVGGNIGIGTTSPGSKLEIVGSGGGSSDGILRLSMSTGGGIRLTDTRSSNQTDFLLSATDYVGGATAGVFAVTDKKNNATRLLINSSGNIGIGTTSPSAKLHVIGEARVGGSDGTRTQLSSNGGIEEYYASEATPRWKLQRDVLSGSRPALIFGTGASSSAFGSPASATLGLFTAGNERMRIDSSGNVGIGRTNPEVKLDFASSTIDVINIRGGFVAGLNSTPTKPDHAVPLGFLESNYIKMWGGSLTGNIWSMNTGNVGIGTTNPGGRLHVESSVAGPTAIFKNASNNYGGLILRMDNSGQANSRNWGIFTDAGAFGNLSFAPSSSNTSTPVWSDAKITFSKDGNVGIGITSPGAKLDVKTNAAPFIGLKISNYGTNVNSLYAGAVDDTSIFFGTGYYYNSNLYRTPGTAAAIARFDGGAFKIFTNSGLTANTDYTPTERFRVSSNGSVGIGTTNNSQKLHINGNVLLESGSYMYFRDTGSYINEYNGLNIVAGSTRSLNLVGGSGTNGIRIATNGRVGINNDTPNGLLDVAISTAIDYPAVSVHSNQTAGVANLLIKTAHNPNNERYFIDAQTVAATDPGSKFWVNHMGRGYFKGELGIGTTNPQQKLTISGSSVAGGGSQSNISAFTGNGLRINGNGIDSAQDAITYQSGGGGGSAIAFGRGGGYDTFISFYTNNTSAAGAIFERMRIIDSGNVGIGTTTPAQKLHAVGYIRGDSGFCIGTNCITSWPVGTDSQTLGVSGNTITLTNGGSVTAPYATTAGSLAANGANCLPGQYPLGVSATGAAESCTAIPTLPAGSSGATLRYTTSWVSDTNLYNNGTSVGIGRTPSYKLDVNGDFRTSGVANVESPVDQILNLRQLGISGTTNVKNAGWNYIGFLDSEGDRQGYFGMDSSGNMLFNPEISGSTVRTNSSFIVTSGNLSISNGGFTQSGAVANSFAGNVGIGTTDPSAALDIANGWLKILNVNGTGYGIDFSQGPTLPVATIVPNGGQSLVFSLINQWGGFDFKSHAGTSLLRIVNLSGDVGIGTTNPDSRLEVSKSLSGGVGGVVKITNPIANAAGNGVELRLAPSSAHDIRYASIRGINISGNNDMAIAFLTGNAALPTEKMRIDHLGNVGIGTTSPGYKLDVNGSVGAQSFTYNSDARLKKNIKTIKNPLGKILSLRGVTFNWKDSGDASVGLIAQEVEKVFPELVNGNDIKGVEYGNLVAPLIEAVKEQQRMIDKLEARIDILEKKSNTK